MTETFVAHVNGSHACYVTSNGRDRHYLGCSHQTPRAAHDPREEVLPDARIPAPVRDPLVSPETESELRAAYGDR